MAKTIELHPDLSENEKMSTAKLAIMILVIAALLFVVAPKLSWGSSDSKSVGRAKQYAAVTQDSARTATSLK